MGIARQPPKNAQRERLAGIDLESLHFRAQSIVYTLEAAAGAIDDPVAKQTTARKRINFGKNSRRSMLLSFFGRDFFATRHGIIVVVAKHCKRIKYRVLAVATRRHDGAAHLRWLCSSPPLLKNSFHAVSYSQQTLDFKIVRQEFVVLKNWLKKI